MKILTIIPLMGAGGAEVVAAALTRDAAARGHEVTLASAGGFRQDELVASGVRVLEVPLGDRRPGNLLRTVRMLRHHVRLTAPDLVTAHNVKAALIARLAAGQRTPVVTTLHGVAASELPAAARILRHTTDRLIAVSPFVADQVVGQGFPREQVTTIANSIAPLARLDRDDARAALGLAPTVPVALCLARMVDQKRHDLLLRAWAQVQEPAILLLAGDGPLRADLEHLARHLGISDRVRFLGTRMDVEVLLAATDLSVLSTRWEGMPISMLEAMSLAIPVVVTEVGGVVETLGDAVRTVRPDSIESLAEALTELLVHDAERRDLGARGAELVARRYAPESMIDAHEAVHREALRNRRVPSPRMRPARSLR